MSLDSYIVCQDTVCVRCRHRPFDDHLTEGDRGEHTEHATHTLCDHVPIEAWSCVLIHSVFAGLFGIVLQCNLTISLEAQVRVAA